MHKVWSMKDFLKKQWISCISQILGLLVIIGYVSGQHYLHGPLVNPLAYKIAEHEAPAHYDFSYSVNDPHTGDVKSQSESRKGDVLHGTYSLIDADGYLRTVDYTSDAHNGFNAVVKREPLGHKAPGPAPLKLLAPAPIIHAAPLSLLHASPKILSPAITHVSVHGGTYAYSHWFEGWRMHTPTLKEKKTLSLTIMHWKQ